MQNHPTLAQQRLRTDKSAISTCFEFFSTCHPSLSWTLSCSTISSPATSWAHLGLDQTLMPVLEALTCTLHIMCPLLFLLDVFCTKWKLEANRNILVEEKLEANRNILVEVFNQDVPVCFKFFTRCIHVQGGKFFRCSNYYFLGSLKALRNWTHKGENKPQFLDKFRSLNLRGS